MEDRWLFPMNMFNTLWFERYYPHIIGIVLGFVAYNQTTLVIPTDTSVCTSLFSAAISLSAVLVGFLATMYAVLMTLPSMIRRLSKLDYVDVVQEYFNSGIVIGLAFSILNISAFFYLKCTEQSEQSLFISLWVMLGSMMFLTFFRVARMMSAIFTKLANPQP
jgi:hypothetical protein